MKATILSWLEALGVDPSAEGLEVVFQTDEFLARWQKAWEEVVPGAMVSTPDLPAAPAQRGSTLGAASALWELARRLRTRQSGLIAEVGEGRSGYAGFRLDGPVRWRGLWGPLASGVAPPNATFLNRRFELGAVSQGAYVPHARYLENLASRWRLEAERCAHCQALTFPTAGRCTACGHSDGLRPEPLRAEGLTVESVTTISPGAQPTEFDPIVAAAGPYDVVVATVAPGVRATFQVTDAPPGHLRIGDRVRLALRRLYPMDGEWRYGLKAVPDRGPAPTPATRRRRRASGAPRGHRASPRARVAVRRTPRRSAR